MTHVREYNFLRWLTQREKAEQMCLLIRMNIWSMGLKLHIYRSINTLAALQKWKWWDKRMNWWTDWSLVKGCFHISELPHQANPVFKSYLEPRDSFCGDAKTQVLLKYVRWNYNTYSTKCNLLFGTLGSMKLWHDIKSRTFENKNKLD